MKMEEYLDELKGQIRDKYAKEFVADEVRAHIEDQSEAYEEDGLSYEDAVSKAVAEMGDPVSVGVDLDRIHRPHMEWRFLLYIFFMAVLNLGVQYIVNRNMPAETGAGILENLSRVNIMQTVIGFAAMLGVYRLDYTILAGRSRMIGAAYLVLLILLSFFFGAALKGMTSWIRIGMFSVPIFALMVPYLPIFAGILYEYRGKGKAAIVKIVIWMFAPVLLQLIAGYISFPVLLFIVVSEILLFGIALKKDWYAVNKKIVAAYGAGALVLLISGALVHVYSRNGYQSARLKNWLAHFGIGSYAANADSTINYVNSRLSGAFSKSNLIGGSDAALSVMKEIPTCRSDLILGSVAATCGIVAVAGIIICLAVLAIYVFNISLRQKNSLGCMIGCSCGVALGLQSLSNILVVFGVLPLTDSVLPFFASGLSFTIVDYVLLGLVLSIYRYKDIRREKQAANLALRRIE